ncbi:DUF1861 family protein [Candidatus Pacearchaeota archaeon]|nr:DUF1861 family protein [Candidatus Pacearchaeota archaeon]
MKSVKSILKTYNKPKIKNIKKLKFLHVRNQNVYNITAPFKYEDKIYIIGRVENQKDDTSILKFFRKVNSNFVPEDTFQKFELEDPSLVRIGDSYVLSGVETKPLKNKLRWRTVFYKGKNLRKLTKFTIGPWGMKDIRLIELDEGKIGVFTRPQGKKGRRGRIGYFEISSLKELKPRKISNAPILKDLFSRGEWGGVNDLLILRSGKIGVLGHIARFSKDKNKFYYPMVFAFDPKTHKTSTIKLIGRRAELPEGDSKTPDLYNVIFPGGIIRRKGNLAQFYVGVADTESYEITIADPFKYYEKNDKQIFG